jgi:hypothetical protein
MTHQQIAALDSTELAKVVAALENEITGGGQPRSHPSISTNLLACEEKFGISTAEMLRKFAAGTLPDDEEISEWLFWAGAANRICPAG